MGKYESLIEPKLPEIGQMTEQGLSEEKIAASLGVAYSTFREYKKKYPALSAVLKKSADARNEVIENSLYESAKGKQVKVKKPVKVRRVEYDPTTGKKVKEYEEVVTAEEEEYIPPNPTSIIFYLTNRLPDKYKNNPAKLKLDEEKLKLAKEKAEKEDW